jgi:hypothetical protein
MIGCSGPSELRAPGALRDSLGGDSLGCFRFESTPGELEVVARLEIHPELGRGAEEEGEPERGIRTNTAPIVNDLCNPVRGDPERARQLGLGQRKTSQEFLGKNFSWRNWAEFVLLFRSHISLQVNGSQ